MGEKEPLLLSSPPLGPFITLITQKQKIETKVKSGYIKFIGLIHAREFLAELLATFILVVSVCYAISMALAVYTCMFVNSYMFSIQSTVLSLNFFH